MHKYKSDHIVFEYKKNTSIDERRKQYNMIKSKHHDKIPIIIEFDKTLNQPYIKILVESTTYVSELIYFIKNKIHLSPEKGIFLLTDDKVMLSSNQSLYLIHNSMMNTNEDNFLYIFVNLENTFG